MPLTDKGREILAGMKKTYGSDKKAEQVFYASANKGTIKNVHEAVPENLKGLVGRKPGSCPLK